MAQDQDLDLLGGVGSGAQHDPAQELEERLVDHRSATSVPATGRGRTSRSRAVRTVSGTHTATQPLGAAGVQLFKNKRGTGVRKVHHKLMVVDDQLLILGSFKDTEPATTLNDENIVVIGDLEETDPAAQADQRQLAAFARAEIDRIITELAQPV